ncbi:MAG: class I SAM-dependent methyltransferase [Acetobacteraceae bacterium]|nr:class I SAM-dependent methyltransferase [Acetobacteraceae bacterium]
MARWDDGYVTDTVYTSQFHRETTPAWLATAALLLGHHAPDLSRPFRYADLGCGNGFTALVVAATCPHAEVWGFDFNPAHIESARSIAARAGLANIRFIESSFGELASRPEAALPDFDFMVTHGVLSWISPENQRHLIDTIGRRLRPGGLAYVSYNVTTGMANMLPLRTLMRMMAEATTDRSDLAVGGILTQLDRLKQAGAAFFQVNPALENRLRDMRAQDPRYLAHEFLNRDWRPMMFADVADAMAEAKCRFIGSATLAENIDATSVPAGVAPLLGETRDQRLRETLRDIGAAQSFRRDIYRRGITPTLVAEQHAGIDALTLGWTGLTAGEQVTINTGLGTITGKAELYRPLLERLQAGAATVPQLTGAVQHTAAEVLQALTLLMAGGYAHPLLPASVGQAAGPGSRTLNQAIVAMNSGGGDLSMLAAPIMGTALNCDLLETLVVGALMDGTPQTVGDLAQEVLRRLARGGRSMQRDGQAVTDPQEAVGMVSGAITGALERRLQVWRNAGILPG